MIDMDFKIGSFAKHKNVIHQIKKLDVANNIAICDDNYTCFISELKHIFEPPFSTDDYGIYMFDADNNICLEYNPATTYDETTIHQIAKILNGEDTWFPHDINKATVVKNATDCFVMFENGDVLTVRSWGYLTGVKHLSNKDAAAVQDNFLDYIVNKIKESQK